MMEDDPYPDTNRETNEVVEAINSLRNVLTDAKIASERGQGRPRTIIPFHSDTPATLTNIFSSHVRMYMEKFIWTGHEVLAGAGISVHLHIGGVNFAFNYDITMPQVVDFPYTIEPGVDVYFQTHDAAHAPVALHHSNAYIIAVVGE